MERPKPRNPRRPGRWQRLGTAYSRRAIPSAAPFDNGARYEAVRQEIMTYWIATNGNAITLVIFVVGISIAVPLIRRYVRTEEHPPDKQD